MTSQQTLRNALDGILLSLGLPEDIAARLDEEQLAEVRDHLENEVLLAQRALDEAAEAGWSDEDLRHLETDLRIMRTLQSVMAAAVARAAESPSPT